MLLVHDAASPIRQQRANLADLCLVRPAGIVARLIAPSMVVIMFGWARFKLGKRHASAARIDIDNAPVGKLDLIDHPPLLMAKLSLHHSSATQIVAGALRGLGGR